MGCGQDAIADTDFGLLAGKSLNLLTTPHYPAAGSTERRPKPVSVGEPLSPYGNRRADPSAGARQRAAEGYPVKGMP